jgi:hypothetical protein
MEESLGVRLLRDLRHLFGEDAVMASKTILDSLYKIEESPWEDLKGKPLTERGLAKLLKEYGVRSKLIRIGETVARGYSRADLVDAWARYVPAIDVTSVTSVTTQPDGAAAELLEPTLPLTQPGEPDPDGWSFNLEG